MKKSLQSLLFSSCFLIFDLTMKFLCFFLLSSYHFSSLSWASTPVSCLSLIGLSQPPFILSSKAMLLRSMLYSTTDLITSFPIRSKSSLVNSFYILITKISPILYPRKEVSSVKLFVMLNSFQATTRPVPCLSGFTMNLQSG